MRFRPPLRGTWFARSALGILDQRFLLISLAAELRDNSLRVVIRSPLPHSGEVTPFGQRRPSRYLRADSSSGKSSKSLNVLIVERLTVYLPIRTLPCS